MSQHTCRSIPDLSQQQVVSSSTWKEPGVDQVLNTLLKDEQLADVALKAKDGIVVKANRCILAARSNVFRRMLFGEFLESSSPTINVGFDGLILKAVIQYIYTGSTANIIIESSKPPNGDTIILVPSGHHHRQQAFQLVSLARAASFYNLLGLLKEAGQAAERVMKSNPELSLVFFENGAAAVDRQSHSLRKLALQFIRQNPNKVFTNNTIPSLTVATLEAIVKDDQVNMNELAFFHLIQKWAANAAGAAAAKESDDDETTEGEGERAEMEVGNNNNNNRKATAKSLMKQYIRLELISPKELSTTVSTSGLVSRDQLYEAYKAQALKTMNDSNTYIYSGPRFAGKPRWVHTDSDTFTVDATAKPNTPVRRSLVHPGMKDGIHHWTIKIVKIPTNHSLSLGIQSTHHESEKKIVWRYSDSGSLYLENNRVAGPRKRTFAAGDEVSFILNMKQDDDDESSNNNKQGFLDASINGGPQFTLFENLIPLLNSKDPSSSVHQGVVPMARLFPSTTVKVLSMRQELPAED